MIYSNASQTYHIYTDGGCLPNRRGAWAFIVLMDEKVVSERSGTAKATTSVRMELEAAIQALEFLPKKSRSFLWTDSRVVLEIVQIKIPQWKANSWRRSRGQAVIDLDLVQKLDELIGSRDVAWRWVRAHSGNRHNEHCDSLCRLALGDL